jgi:hypothetical protein
MYIPASDAHRVFAHLSLSLTVVLLQIWQCESYREALRRISRHLRQAVIGQALPVYVSLLPGTLRGKLRPAKVGR